MQELPDGRIALELKTPWADGSTHVLYEPLDLIAKLAALIPRPHKNLVLYHGVLSANAALRSRVVAYGRDLGLSPDNAAPSGPLTALRATGGVARCLPVRELQDRRTVPSYPSYRDPFLPGSGPSQRDP